MLIRAGFAAGLASLLLATSGFAQTAAPPAAAPAAGAPPAGARPAPPPAQVISPFADPAVIPLSNARPTGPEQWTIQYGGRIARNVTVGSLTPVLPDPAKATGAAVIIAPGGGFFMLSMDTEGYQVAQYLADRGIAAFVLKYRVNSTPAAGASAAAATAVNGATPNTPPPTPRRFETPAPALEDARAALRLVRARAASWGIDPKRVGFMGFSAGAVTTLDVTFKSPADIRPNFIASIYGPMYAQDIPADAPPMFNAVAIDDGLMAADDIGIITTYHRANRPVEFHLYQNGGHGFGMRKRGMTADLWIDQFYAWMQARGLLNRS
jgi:acetyl esterase/lipase